MPHKSARGACRDTPGSRKRKTAKGVSNFTFWALEDVYERRSRRVRKETGRPGGGGSPNETFPIR